MFSFYSKTIMVNIRYHEATLNIIFEYSDMFCILLISTNYSPKLVLEIQDFLVFHRNGNDNVATFTGVS